MAVSEGESTATFIGWGAGESVDMPVSQEEHRSQRYLPSGTASSPSGHCCAGLAPRNVGAAGGLDGEKEMLDQPARSVLVSEPTVALSGLRLSWDTAMFSAEDGIGPMASLEQAGDAVAVLARMEDSGLKAIGSGVMVAPGLMLTATHVLEELQQGTALILTFVPDGEARLWLPTSSSNARARGAPNLIGPSTCIDSDISLVACDLASEAHARHPLMLAPMAIELPLPGQRLWAYGFRDGDIVDGTTLISPFVSSGLVSQCFPNGRGSMSPAPCIEIDMEAYGGMSGGPVVNDDGELVAIVSSSFDDGPTYAMLIWDALRLDTTRSVGLGNTTQERIDLLTARDLGVAQLRGVVSKDEYGNVEIGLQEEAMSVLVNLGKGSQHDG